MRKKNFITNLRQLGNDRLVQYWDFKFASITVKTPKSIYMNTQIATHILRHKVVQKHNTFKAWKFLMEVYFITKINRE